jgi:hypothetical protein
MIEMEKVFKIKNNLKNLQFNSVEPTPRSNVYACVSMKYYSQSPVWKLLNARAFDLAVFRQANSQPRTQALRSDARKRGTSVRTKSLGTRLANSLPLPYSKVDFQVKHNLC